MFQTTKSFSSWSVRSNEYQTNRGKKLAADNTGRPEPTQKRTPDVLLASAGALTRASFTSIFLMGLTAGAGLR